MYQCNNCNYKFEEPNTQRITYEQYYGVSSLFDSSTPWDLQVCPNCKSDDFEELMQCDFCEEWVNPEELIDTEGKVNKELIWACPKCIDAYNLVDKY